MVRDEKYIEELLDRYFEGQTSLAEESALRDYFASAESIPPHLEYARAMFGYFHEAAEEKMSHDFTPVYDLTEVPPTQRRVSYTRRIITAVISVAAVAAIALTLTFSLSGLHESAQEPAVYCYVNGQPVTDYDTALAYTQKALAALSEPFKVSAESIAPIGELERPVRIAAQLSNMDKLLNDPKNM
jgi:hypothetical protein